MEQSESGVGGEAVSERSGIEETQWIHKTARAPAGRGEADGPSALSPLAAGRSAADRFSASGSSLRAAPALSCCCAAAVRGLDAACASAAAMATQQP